MTTDWVDELRSIQLSPNLNIFEAIRSDTAERHPQLVKQQYHPPEHVVNNLIHIATTTFQPLRDALGHPIRVTSGYRHPSINKLVGGSPTSQHVVGEALDLKTSGLTGGTKRSIRTQAGILLDDPFLERDANDNFYIFAYCCIHLDDFDIDQVIHEYGTPGRPSWVHVSSSTRQNRREILAVSNNWSPKWRRNMQLEDALRLGT